MFRQFEMKDSSEETEEKKFINKINDFKQHMGQEEEGDCQVFTDHLLALYKENNKDKLLKELLEECFDAFVRNISHAEFVESVPEDLMDYKRFNQLIADATKLLNAIKKFIEELNDLSDILLKKSAREFYFALIKHESDNLKTISESLIIATNYIQDNTSQQVENKWHNHFKRLDKASELYKAKQDLETKKINRKKFLALIKKLSIFWEEKKEDESEIAAIHEELKIIFLYDVDRVRLESLMSKPKKVEIMRFELALFRLDHVTHNIPPRNLMDEWFQSIAKKIHKRLEQLDIEQISSEILSNLAVFIKKIISCITDPNPTKFNNITYFFNEIFNSENAHFFEIEEWIAQIKIALFVFSEFTEIKNKDLFEKMVSKIFILPTEDVGLVKIVLNRGINRLLAQVHILKTSENDATVKYLEHSIGLLCIDLIDLVVGKKNKFDISSCEKLIATLEKCIASPSIHSIQAIEKARDLQLPSPTLRKNFNNILDAILLRYNKVELLANVTKIWKSGEKSSLSELTQKFSEAYDRRIFPMGEVVEQACEKSISLGKDLYDLFYQSSHMPIDQAQFQLAAYELKRAGEHSQLHACAKTFAAELENKKSDILKNPQDLKTITTLVEDATTCAYKPTKENLEKYNNSLEAAQSTHIGNIPWKKSKLAARALGFGIAALGAIIALGSFVTLVYTGFTSAPLSLAGLQMGAELMGAGLVLGVVGIAGGNKLVNKMDEWLTNRNLLFKSALDVGNAASNAIKSADKALKKRQ